MAAPMLIELDPDVAEKLRRESERLGKTPHDIVNDAMREKLPEEQIVARPFKVRPRSMGTPLIDLDCTGRALDLIDELEHK